MIPQGSLDYQSLSHEWVQNARDEGWEIDSVDALVFERTTQEFGIFLESRMGREDLEKLFGRIRTPYDFEPELASVFGVTFGQLFEGFYAFEESRSVAGRQWAQTQSEHFTFSYKQASAAAADIELIKAVAEQSFSEISAMLALDSSALSRVSLVLRADGEEPYFGGKILMRLHPDRRNLGIFEPFSGGQTRFGTMWFEDTLAYLLWIDIAYPGPAGLFGLPHEIAHSAALLFLSDMDKLCGLLRGGEQVPADTLRSAVLPDDLLRLEGWAFMVQHNYSAYARLGLWSPTREAMAASEFPDSYNMLNREANKSPLDRRLGITALARGMNSSEIQSYLISSADLLRYLYERYGPQKLRMFLSNQKSPMDALLEVYDLTPYALEQAWRNDVMGN